ncbi:MAG: minichromosome maintenance protein MCM [Candidatus Nitrosocosmicus sp.]|nr:minichromosome maintenance protein MCM [Candidatus Nitrosocosmicus sp.]
MTRNPNPYEYNPLREDDNGNEIEDEDFTEKEAQEQGQEGEYVTDSATSNLIEAFLRSYKDKKTGQYKYFNHISTIAFSSEAVFNLDFDDVFSYTDSDSFVNIFYEDIDKALEATKEAVESVIYEINSDYKSANSALVVRVSGFDISRSFREIDADLIDKMVTIDAIVNRSSKKKPWLLASVYKCKECGQANYAQHNKIVKKCLGCESNKLVFDKKNSKYVGHKTIQVQELPENLPPGQLPEKLNVSLYGNDLVNKCRPGDRIKMTCIVRLDYDTNTLRDLEKPDPLGIQGKNFGTTFEMVLDANNIEKLDSFNSLANGGSNSSVLTDSDIEKITALRNNYDLPQKLVNSFAPHIYGHEIHKEAILLMIVGSITRDGNRGDSNILFVGDAGLAKSEMLKFAMKITPRGLYTTGGGSSAAGLTAAVVKDKSGAMMLEAGAVVMADQGLCCIDEFDKLKGDDRAKLHEAMEQQTCSIAKGGIVATLNARTSILAAANPINSVYDPLENIVANTGLPPTIISRFDLIYVLKDVINMEDDSAVADYVLGIPSTNNKQQLVMKQYGSFDAEFLSKYIMYVKHYQKELPELTIEAKMDIKYYYNMLRQRAEKDSNNAVQSMTVTPRIIKALERLSIARARLLLKDKVTIRETDRAKFLMNQMFKSFGIDIETGKVNVGIMFGKPVAQMSKMNVLTDTLAGLTNNGQDDIDYDVLLRELMTTKKFHSENEAERSINDCIREGVLLKRKGNIYSFNKSAMFRG